MKYTIGEIRYITHNAQIVNTAKLDKYLVKKERKEDKFVRRLLKKLEQLIIRTAKRGCEWCYCNLGEINARQKDTIEKYLKTRLYDVLFIDVVDILIRISWG